MNKIEIGITVDDYRHYRAARVVNRQEMWENVLNYIDEGSFYLETQLKNTNLKITNDNYKDVPFETWQEFLRECVCSGKFEIIKV